MDDPIRVLCVFSTLDRGGAESMCMNLYRHMDRSKVQFDFVKHTNMTGQFEDEIKSLGGNIYQAPRLKYYNIISYNKWWKKHLSEHPEHQIIHGHFYTISAVYLKAAKKMGRLTIAHAHSCEPYKKGLRAGLRRQLLSQIEKQADYCFACSKAAGRWLFPHRKFRILPNAIDTAAFEYSEDIRNKIRNALGIQEKQLLIGTVGSIYDIKNPMAVCEIFKAVHSQRPDARFLWVGDGPMLGQVQKKLTEDELIRAVIFTGVRDDVNKLLQAMDAFILPSHFEGLPVVLIEAQAAGVHCYCSDVITKEVNICDLCTFLPNTNYKLWAYKILEDTLEKTVMFEKVKNAGYDIHSCANKLQNFYIDVNNKRKR